MFLALLSLAPALLRGAREGPKAGRSARAKAIGLCDGVEDALVCLTDVVMRDTDEQTQSCRVHVEKSFCTSVHPFWECNYDDETLCSCRRSDACRGVAEALKAKDGLHLTCSPRASACTCAGFESCPPQGEASGQKAAEAKAWECNNSDFAFERLRVAHWSKKCEDAMVLPEKAELEAFEKQGGCQCSPLGQVVTLTLSPSEFAALRKHPLASFNNSLPKTGLLGQEIKEAETHVGKDGKQRVVLKVHKEDHDKEAEAQAKMRQHAQHNTSREVASLAISDAHEKLGAKLHRTAAAVENPAGEEGRCVITEGRPEFDKRVWLVFVVMVMPALVSIIAVFTLRQCCCAAPDVMRLRGLGAGGDSGGTVLRDGSQSSPVAMIPHGVSEDDTARWPNSSFLVLSVLMMVLLRLNTSMILTTSDIMVAHALSLDTGKGAHVARRADELLEGAASGMLLAADPVGGILGVILTARFFLLRPRDTLVYACALAGLGNLAFWAALRASSVAFMVAARVVGGFSGGAVFLGQVYLVRATSKDLRTAVFGLSEASVAIGLLGGPAITAALGSNFDLSIDPLGESSALSISILALCMLLAVYTFCPQDAELGAAGLDERHPCWWPDEHMSHEKWIMQWMLSGSSLVRQLMRLIWEASSVTILSVHFCLGYAKSGFGVSAVLAMTVLAQLVFLRFSGWTSNWNLVRLCALAELFGLLIIWRTPVDMHKQIQEDVIQPLTSVGNIVKFLLGSGLFYAGNVFTAAPLTSRAVSSGPREVCLLFYSHLSMYSGIAGGALLSRIFTSYDPHQNTVVVMLLPVVLVQVVLAELSLRPIGDGGEGQKPLDGN